MCFLSYTISVHVDSLHSFRDPLHNSWTAPHGSQVLWERSTVDCPGLALGGQVQGPLPPGTGNEGVGLGLERKKMRKPLD